jgi:hypothetical protein
LRCCDLARQMEPVHVTRKRQSFTVEKKVEITHEVDKTQSQVNVAKLYNITATTVNAIHKNRVRILDEWNRGCIKKKHFKSVQVCNEPVHAICGDHDPEEEGFGKLVTCSNCAKPTNSVS